jgi:hypothetical protein
MPSCFLCGTNATVQPGSRGGHLVQCPACARYEISGTLEVTIAAPQWAARRHLLSGMTRASDAGDTKFLHLTTDNVEDLVAAARRPSNMIEILDNLLLLGAARTESFGSRVNFSPIDWPLVFARDVLEFESLLRGLAALGYWEVSSGLQGKITVSGWKRLQQIRETAHRSWQAFVAMWFDKKQMGDILRPRLPPHCAAADTTRFAWISCSITTRSTIGLSLKFEGAGWWWLTLRGVGVECTSRQASLAA